MQIGGAIYQPNLLISHRMLLLRKDSGSWKRVSGLMDHWDQWRQMPQVSCRAKLDYLFVTQWWLCMMTNYSASKMQILCSRGLMYCLNNQEQSFYQVVEANKLLGDFLQQRLGLDCTQDDVEHCWGVLQVSTWLNSRWSWFWPWYRRTRSVSMAAVEASSPWSPSSPTPDIDKDIDIDIDIF